MHVAHRGAGRAGGQIGAPHFFAGELVVGPEGSAPHVGLGAAVVVAAHADEEQCPGYERGGAAGDAEGGQVEFVQIRVVAQRISVGDLPDVFTAVHVCSRNAAPGRLGQGDAVRVRRFPVRAPIGHVGVGVVGRYEPVDAGDVVGEAAVPAGFGVEGAGVPVGRAPGARQGQRTLVAARLVADDARRCENRADDEVRHCGAGDFGKIDDVGLGNALGGDRRRFRRERLRGRQDFAGYVGLRHRQFLDRPDRFSRHAVEHVDPAGLVGLHHRLDGPAVDDDVAEFGRADIVVFPDVVMHHLEMPDALAGTRVDGDQAVGIHIVAGAVTAEIRRGGSGEGNVDMAEFLVRRQAAPGTEVSRTAPGIVGPGVGAEFPDG